MGSIDLNADEHLKPEDNGPLESGPKLCAHFAINPRTLKRWEEDPRLDFPKALIINGRKYFYVRERSAWERNRARLSMQRATTVRGTSQKSADKPRVGNRPADA